MYFDPEKFGRRLADLRLRRGMTQEELEEALDLSAGYISRVESGRRACSIDKLCEISELLKVSTDYLLKGEESNTSDACRIKARKMSEELIMVLQKYDF